MAFGCQSTRITKSLTSFCRVSVLQKSGARRFAADFNRESDHAGWKDLAPLIEDDFATVRPAYRVPRNPIILAHGLLGFDEIHIAGDLLPGVQYWRGITSAFASHGIEVIAASVPASASIEERAAKLAKDIEQRAAGRSVNVIAHSMGGLDARYMISKLQPAAVDVLSLTTVATPHRGAILADYILERIGERRLSTLYRLLDSLSVPSGAFEQLTTSYMCTEFNPAVPNRENVQYFSYGANVVPPIFSVFRGSHGIVYDKEGPNDGLVSVKSSRWGQYRGTLVNVHHLDLINWTNRLRILERKLVGMKRNFNAIALYLNIAEMLADEGF